jgi:ABC-type polysaccharide/polyol phosphate export permease
MHFKPSITIPPAVGLLVCSIMLVVGLLLYFSKSEEDWPKLVGAALTLLSIVSGIVWASEYLMA